VSPSVSPSISPSPSYSPSASESPSPSPSAQPEDTYFICNNDVNGLDTLDLYVDGTKVATFTATSIFMYHLKSGANQGAAGAAVGELWVDTNDNTIKIGV
jgi:hypothetical protein